MSRLVAAIAIAAVAAAAALLPAPDPEPGHLDGIVIERLGLESPLDAAIWYCPWAQATTERDSLISLASLTPAEAELTFPVATPGEPADRAEASMRGPGGADVTLSSVALRGDSPSFIEFEGGPSAAAVAVLGDVVAVDTCIARGGDEFFFVGGSTMTGDTLRVRLFNPFPEAATVSITGFSEIGTEVLGDLASITVGARSWRDIEFHEQLRQRQSLVIAVRLDRGIAIPAMAYSRGSDEAWWSGTGVSTEWELPIVRTHGGEEAAVIVANPGLGSVAVEVELYGNESSQRENHTIEVPPGSPMRVDLSEVEFGVVGARVFAGAPIVAASVAEGPDGELAVTAGSPVAGRLWVVPGARSHDDHSTSLWLLNSGEDAVVVTLSRLTSTEVLNVNEILQPGTVTRIPVLDTDTLGYVIRSSEPFSVSWSLSGERGAAYSNGILVPTDE